MVMRTLHVALLGLGFGLASPGLSADSGAECATIDGDQDRLACYDTLFRQPRKAIDEEFGAEQVTHTERSLPPPPETTPTTLVSSIASIEKRPRGELTFTLANGQKWTQQEVEKNKLYRPGDAVTIHRLSLKSYMLTNAKGFSTRVKRLE